MSDRLTSLTAALRRLGCTPADAVALAVLAIAAAAAVGLLWLNAAPRLQLQVPAPTPTGAVASESGIAITQAEVIVHVAGAVARPGVYTLPGGSRVADAVTAAGGPRRRAVLDGLNLARVLADGEQVVVPEAGAAGPPSGSGTPAPQVGAAATPGAAPLVSLNQATPADLETLPGIGAVLASRIIQHRDSIGGFTDVGELRDVPGIGEKTFQSLAPLVRL